MASITFAVDNKLKSDISKFAWVIWSELVKEELSRRQKIANLLFERLNSKEEQELIKWSVELGKKAKKDSFKRLLSEISPKRRGELLNSMSPEERAKYE